MAIAAQRMDDVPLIEEQVETGLADLLDGYRPSYIPGGAVGNELEERFVLNPSAPLREFSHRYAEAFEASDKSAPSRQLYGMVCSPDLPYRLQALTDAAGFTNPNLQLPVASGTVRCSQLNESRLVIFFEIPQGNPVSQLIAQETRLHESKVISQVIDPVARALMALRERKIHHGNLRPEAVTLGPAVLGECFSAPAGMLAHPLYQSVERMMADPMGQGEADEKSDVYALGVLAFELMYGLDRLKAIPREEFVTRALTQGSYQLFANNRDFPSAIQDFFRGVLTDNIVERWNLDQVIQFLGGKRFNMIAPSVPKDGARPFVFMGENILSRRLLAHRLHRNWREATKDIRGLHLDRWCETSLHRPEVAENMERALRIGADHSSTDKQIVDMMTRIMMILDPVGPLRSKTLSLRPDAIPLMFATLAGTQEPELTQLIVMMQSEVVSFWSENLPTFKSPELSQVLWRLERIKPYIKNNHLGFGLERVLYELNPSLPCQSPLLKPFHVTTVHEALSTLDVLAKGRTGDHTLVDRHIAAFLAAKIDLRREIRLQDATSILTLHGNKDLIMLRILDKAQQKQPNLKLVGLAAWAGMHTEKMVNEIHNRVIRKDQKLKLKRRASSGMISEVLSSVLNREVGDRDADGFTHAIALHEINYKRIAFLRNPMILEYKSRKLGGQMAIVISYAALTIMGMSVMTRILGV